jgi:ABC-2 type transport system ATP-binding protein
MIAIATELAVSCRGLSFSFGKHVAVDNVDLEVRRGEIFGLLGPNGAGKTTAIRVVTTLRRPTAGQVEVFGLDVRHEAMRVRRMIGYVPQELSADATLTGRENVMLFARLFDVPRRERHERAIGAIEAMGLADSADRIVKTYSGGMIRRLELAQALVSRPRLLVLDEPTIGLDPIARADLWETIRELREQFGVTVLMTTHYLEEADALCDRIALMHHARLRATGTPDELKLAISPVATLDDVFRHHAGDEIAATGDLRDIRRTRRTARRLG